jgi:glycosyltransferase involved in cell wall biosynthesis
VEALAHGVPAIVRRIGALPEIVEESGAGYTFADLSECRAAMQRLLDRPELRAELGQRGRIAAREKWSVEAHLDRYLDLADSLLRERVGRERIASTMDIRDRIYTRSAE